MDFFGNDIGKASPDEAGEGGVVHFYSLFLGVEFFVEAAFPAVAEIEGQGGADHHERGADGDGQNQLPAFGHQQVLILQDGNHDGDEEKDEFAQCPFCAAVNHARADDAEPQKGEHEEQAQYA